MSEIPTYQDLIAASDMNLQRAQSQNPNVALCLITAAGVQATRALAEQQRIANLIALAKETFAAHEASEALGTFATAKPGEQIGLRPDIAAALGIEGES